MDSKETLKETTAKGLFWGGISNFLQQVIGAIFGIVIARILSPNDYGLVGMLAIFIAVANTIMDSGFTVALVNKKEVRHEDYNAVFWFSVISGIIIYIFLFFLAPLIAHFYNRVELINLSRILFIGFLFNGLGLAHHAIIFKKLMVKERAKIDVISVLISGIIGLVLAMNGFAYWGLAIQTVSNTGIAVLLRWYYSPWKPTFHINFKPLKEMFGFSSKLFITHLLWQINNNIFSVILGKFYGERQVGYYSQGNKWMTLGSTVISGMMTSVAQPVFVQVKEDKERNLNIFRKMIRFGAFISFPCMFGLAFVGEEFILITIGEKWLNSVPFLQLFCIWGAFSYMWSLYTNILMTYGRSDIYLWGIISVCVLQLLSVISMFSLGIFPMLIAYILSFFGGLLFWHYFVNKLIGIQLKQVVKDISPYFLAVVIPFGVAWFIGRYIENIYLLFSMKILVVVIFYVLIMQMTNSVIFKESLSFLFKKKINK